MKLLIFWLVLLGGCATTPTCLSGICKDLCDEDGMVSMVIDDDQCMCADVGFSEEDQYGTM